MPSPLLSVIRDRIRQHGPLTVAEYVDLALYHPELGYYAAAAQRSGRRGDFYTSVDLGPLFGELLEVQLEEMWRLMAQDAGSAFDLVEAAAGNARLARDILDCAAERHPRFYEAIRLHLVEASPNARAQQSASLGPHASRLAGSSGRLPPAVRGVVLANELLDALAPHVVVMRDDGLRELYVEAAARGLVTREGPPSTARLQEYLEAVGVDLQPGWVAEVNLAAFDWVADAASRLVHGFLLLIDYGHPAGDLFSATHAAGTLVSYRQHVSETRDSGPGWLQEPGERDITSQVDFTGVRLAGERAGLQTLTLVDQTYFLLALALVEGWTGETGEGAGALKRRLALKSLMLPGGLGSTHKVLIFGRGVGRPPLRGTASGGRLT